jgi:hypothetical protein
MQVMERSNRTRTDRTPYWTDHWNDIVARVNARRHLLVVCDFEGALAPISAHPDEAALSNEVRCLLRKLVACRGLTLAIVSGGALDDLRNHVGVGGIFFADHGGSSDTALTGYLADLGLTTADAIYIGSSCETFRVLRGALTLHVGAHSANPEAHLRLNDNSDTAAFLFCLLGARLAASQSFDSMAPSRERKPSHFPPLPF